MSSTKRERLLSLDVFRGVTIAAMILVNTPGSWSHVYAPLLHAEWHGCTPTDLIFPFFIFIMGVAIVLSKPKTFGERRPIVIKILKRTLYLFLIGLFLNGFPFFDLSTLRIMGVLQRIAIVFLVCALMHHFWSERKQVITAASLLVLYCAIMLLLPVPGVGPANMEKATNLAAWIDSLILEGHMWRGSVTWDPEGLLSTFPAIVTGLFGMSVGRILFRAEDKNQALIKLFVIANLAVVSGLSWDLFFPINKSLWTSSYVLYTGGLATHCFALTYWALDVKKIKMGISFPSVVFGTNAIFVYALSGILTRVLGLVTIGDSNLTGYAFNFFSQFLSLKNASLLYALLFIGLCYMFNLILYKKKIFIKV